MSFDPHFWVTGVGGKRESEAPLIRATLDGSLKTSKRLHKVRYYKISTCRDGHAFGNKCVIYRPCRHGRYAARYRASAISYIFVRCS